MLKSQLINAMQDRHPHLSALQVKNAVDSIIDRMVDALLSQDRIEIRGFGSFNVHYYPPRRAHNPRTGEFIVTGPNAKPHFKAGSILKALIDKQTQKEEGKN
ncbi:MAG: himD [Gammaproteobacteria bacterium]|jgi:integration host factor subunit beta|nr:himD [Gammaproteobacteria bacterium]